MKNTKSTNAEAKDEYVSIPEAVKIAQADYHYIYGLYQRKRIRSYKLPNGKPYVNIIDLKRYILAHPPINKDIVWDNISPLEGEKFFPITGYDFRYFGTDKGRIINATTGEELINTPRESDGYIQLTIMKDGTEKSEYLHTLMLKERYCNAEGVLLPQYPSFYQFRYYYRNHKKMQNYYISRNGIKNYQRNNRPLLGDGIQEFAPAVGVGMLDATICDIYLVNEAGGIVGRPILTACVDAYSGLCCGYSLSWEGGVYSLRNLMTNVISDKTELCKKHGISINPLQWNCDMLPATLVTDMGKEYVSNTFEQIADLGVAIVNLQPYRPELKGAVEKFFDVVQGLYKPHLKGKGVIEPDYQERGAHDYRKDARLTMADFEKIILRCIVYYNSQRIVENFPYTEKMLADGVKPYASDIWNYGLNQAGANLIPADYNTLVLTLLPRTTGKFSRKGLIVNKLRYKHDGFTERYLNGGTVTAAYNPEDVAEVWLLEKGVYTPFTLIESRFCGRGTQEVEAIKETQKAAVKAATADNIQAKIDLVKHIGIVAASAANQGNTSIKGIRDNRRREQQKTHIDYVKESAANE